MTIPHIDEQLLNVYPKIYYSLPIIRRHRRNFEQSSFWFDEPMDAMLWMLDQIAVQTSGLSCTRSKLKGLICRWYGKEASTAFNRCYKILDKNGFITWEPNSEDNKRHDVWITDKGRRLLAEIKSQRLQDLSSLRQLIENLLPEEQDVVLRVVRLQAENAWIEMMDVEEFQEIPTTKKVKSRKSKGRRRPYARKA